MRQMRGVRLFIMLVFLFGCNSRHRDRDGALQDSGELIARLKHKVKVRAVAFSPDGKLLATGGPEDTSIHLWCGRTGKAIRKLDGDPCSIWSLAFSPDGRTLASGGSRSLRLWDMATFKEIARHAYPGDPVTGLSFSGDGKRLAVPDGFDVHIWERPWHKQAPRQKYNYPGSVEAAVFSPQGRRLAVGVRTERHFRHSEGSFLIQDLSTGKRLPLKNKNTKARSAAFSPDGRVLATIDDDNAVKLWNAETGKKLKEIPDGPGCGYYINGPVAFSPDGTLLAGVTSTDSARSISLWEVATGKKLRVLKGHKPWPQHLYGAILSIAFSPDGKTLASGGEDKFVIMWNLENLVGSRQK